ncbi:MAG: hypothetical protein J6I45_05625 [Clostridia bacterium]|nr:hypothetical protein [Clostridia bacterium]
MDNTGSILDGASVRYGRDELLQTNEYIPLYIGNGSFGGNLDRLGMMNSLYNPTRCFLWHKKHVEIGRDQLECRVYLKLTRYCTLAEA